MFDIFMYMYMCSFIYIPRFLNFVMYLMNSHARSNGDNFLIVEIGNDVRRTI